MGRIRSGAIGLAVLSACVLISATTAAAAPFKVTKVFHYTGHQQRFKVPPGVRHIHVVAVGGHGGSAGNAAGGKPAKATADVRVHPGEVLYVEVGGNAQNAGPDTNPGFNGGGPASTVQGGNGGGASDVRTVSRPTFDSAQSLASRLLVAAGGGGAGGAGEFAFGGACGRG